MVNTIYCFNLGQFTQIEISFEGIVALRDKTFLVYQFNHIASATCHVCFGSGEVEVHDSRHTGLYETLGKDVFASTSLVGRQYVASVTTVL